MMRSDNDWLIYNLEGGRQGHRRHRRAGRLGRFSRLVVRDGTLDMNDALYGLFRTFARDQRRHHADADGTAPRARSRASFGGTIDDGHASSALTEADGSARLKADITNIDFASFMPFIDDPDSIDRGRGRRRGVDGHRTLRPDHGQARSTARSTST